MFVCELEVEWPEPETWRPQRERIYQAYVVVDGLITEIRGHDDLASALEDVTG